MERYKNTNMHTYNHLYPGTERERMRQREPKTERDRERKGKERETNIRVLFMKF